MPAPSSAPTPTRASKKKCAIPQNSARETLANNGLAELCAHSSSPPANMTAPNMAALAGREWTDSELFYNLSVNIHARLTPQANQQSKFTLKGLKPTEIGALGTVASTYKNADFTQITATQSASDLLLTLNKHVAETLNPLRRERQLASDTQCP